MKEENAIAKIDRSKAYKYDELNNDVSSVFYKTGSVGLFTAATSVGYYFKKRIPLPANDERQDIFQTSTLGGNSTSSFWVWKSIAMTQEGIVVLKSLKDVVSICQEYANYGIDYIYDVHKKSQDETRDYANQLYDILDDKCN